MQIKRYEEFVPFSIGKRQCFGESFARLEIFLFCVNIFNQFKVSFFNNDFLHLVFTK